MRFLAALTALVSLVAVSSSADEALRIPDHASNEAYWQRIGDETKRPVCFVLPDLAGGDDAPAIMRALNYDCRKRSVVVFPGPVYHIESNMTTVDMDDVEIHHYGRFLWSPDVDYWRSVSMPVGFQNQTTVWYFGGDRVSLDGHGLGTLDGNGQVWYDWARGLGNLPRRPMMVNFRRLTNSRVAGMRFVQSQMWTMAVTHSQHVEFADIYVNNTSTSRWSTLNTDGIDTIWSDDITLRRWRIKSGDDAVALKGNSTNVRVLDTEIYGGQGLAIGSVGQYKDRHEHVTSFLARNVTLFDTTYAIYLKTWGGNSKGFPPNGGGGGLGFMSGIVLEDVKLRGVRKYPLFAWQCENYEGGLGRDCQSSKFSMRDFTARGISGWAKDSVDHVGWFQCSVAAGGCSNFTVSDVHMTRGSGGDELTSWHCENMHEHAGFQCSQ
ncbi:exo-polygalacturonase [Cordyceps fumosorosea ARSEF 2679]|uniref:Exo-polygalacturonase n=1 Tax=Cordyceps fumosorosea (strain ARSEF 2679) TaxID=1081104 RepID=A0A167VYV1_CORFA|nr:exo-polygalacturonase [Cordyceps fumosorosea ARSEF 2679]OAA63131.1 exo-polygalacturonase [Cordyceps fumosorosea ARSEF 2679]